MVGWVLSPALLTSAAAATLVTSLVALLRRRKRCRDPAPSEEGCTNVCLDSTSLDEDSDRSLASRMRYHVSKGLCTREECSAFLASVCRFTDVESVIQEDLVVQSLSSDARACKDEAIKLVCDRVCAEAERLYGCRMVVATDWAVKSLGFHTTYHQDEYAYCTDRSSYTAWILLDRTALAKSSGLDIVSFEANRALYADVFRRFDSRCLLVRDAVFSYFAPPPPPLPPLRARLHALMQSLRSALTVALGTWLEWRFERLRYAARAPEDHLRAQLSALRGLTPTPSAAQPYARYVGSLVVDRLEHLEAGDFVIFNSGLFHSSSNPAAREPAAYKFYYKMHLVCADATLTTAPIDDYGASSFTTLRVGDRLGAWESPARQMIVRERRPTSFARVCAIKGTRERSELPGARIVHKHGSSASPESPLLVRSPGPPTPSLDAGFEIVRQPKWYEQPFR